jgi:hypothetical protein
MHPYLTAGLLIGGGLALAAWLNGRRKYSDQTFIERERRPDRPDSDRFNQAAAGGF